MKERIGGCRLVGKVRVRTDAVPLPKTMDEMLALRQALQAVQFARTRIGVRRRVLLSHLVMAEGWIRNAVNDLVEARGGMVLLSESETSELYE